MDDHNHLDENAEDRLIAVLNRMVRFAIRILAVLMTAVIFWAVADVLLVLYEKLSAPPVWLLDMSDIFQVFAAFLAVLIAIEILANITLYLRDDVIHVKLVVATALMAIARKVIVLDLSVLEPAYLYAIAAIVIALGITYWLLSFRTGKANGKGRNDKPRATASPLASASPPAAPS
ncbi:MAG: phosphate-starvation-inducible PsiE family protein [Dechloromonas sp.]|nr:MAG: phosphate-starvation-inducible PsiE family protein [Dechloromonas sp.]